jgi:hypothetical protein
MQAHSYANQASRIENGTFNIHDMVGRLKDAIPGKESSKGVININAPTWKKDEFRKVRNPEVKTSFKTVNEDAFSPKFAKTQQKRTIYSTLEKEVFTNKGNVSIKEMEGSKAYQKNSLGEIREFAKANTKRFLKGTGKAAMGAAMIGGGLAYAANQFKKHGK